MHGSILLSVILAFIFGLNNSWGQDDFSQWTIEQSLRSYKFLHKNISPPASVPGTVVASPSRSNPDYYFHWVRDASLVMLTLERFLQKTSDPVLKDYIAHQFFDFVYLTRSHQQQNSAGSLGEVKYHIDGRPFVGPWGRPQNDGPALRAMALIQFAYFLIKEGKEDFVRLWLYDSNLPSESIIKKDLEYVAHNWRNKDFDLWEEVEGHHFFTRLVQRRALKEGAALATFLGDQGASDFYSKESVNLEKEILRHWDGDNRFFKASLNPTSTRGKAGLDSSIFIALISTYREGDSFLKLSDDKIMGNAQSLKDSFSKIYQINLKNPDKAPLIGRYPEDTYNGYETNALGNPWFIATLDFASYHYKLAKSLSLDFKKGKKLLVTPLNVNFIQDIFSKYFSPRLIVLGQSIKNEDQSMKQLIKALQNEGDAYLKGVRSYVGPLGEMSEQVNRDSGQMQGAQHLTWSYASFLNAFFNRAEAL